MKEWKLSGGKNDNAVIKEEERKREDKKISPRKRKTRIKNEIKIKRKKKST